MKIPVTVVKAFTQDPHAGNPAGVIFDADFLSADQMQSVASKLNFSESVFILKSEKSDCAMRYFSPAKEVDYCAHATVAAVAALHPTTAIRSHETRAGIFKIQVNRESTLISLWQKQLTVGPEVDKQVLAPLLGLDVASIDSALPCHIVSTGVPKLVIPIQSLSDLLAIQPDYEGIKEFCAASSARGFYPFTTQTLHDDSDFHARQFNPLAGINEDPITGIAAGALGAYWAHRHHDFGRPYVIEQGYNMDKFGKVYVTVDANDQEPVMISGHAAVVGQVVLDI